MGHTFLVREGHWLSEGAMRVDRNPPEEHRHRYEIAPLAPGALSTHWTAENERLGALQGRFVVAGDAILSFYASATGRYRGFECLQQQDAKHYLVRGAMLEQDKVLGAWALTLELAS